MSNASRRPAVIEAAVNPNANRGLLDLLVRLLQPIARLLLKRGVTVYEFTEIARWVFVRVALDKHGFGVPGREVWSTTKARAAVLTGLTRREVDRLSKLPAPAFDVAHVQYHRGFRVLDAWLRTPGFQDAAGQPRDLPIRGRTGSLETLVRQNCRDITVRAMLDELQARNCVVRLDKETVRFMRGDYIRLSINEHEPEHLCLQAERFMAALDERLNGKEPAHTLFIGLDLGGITPKHRALLTERLRACAQSFVHQVRRETAPLQQPLLPAHSGNAFVGLYAGCLPDQD